MQQLTRVVVRNSALGIGAQFAIKALSFGFTILIVRHLGPEAFGQYAAALAFGGMFIFLADLGLSPYLVREVARMRGEPGGPERVGELYGAVLPLRLVLSLVAAVVVVAAASLTGRPPLMIVAIALGGIGLVIYGVQGTSDAVLAGFERLDLSAAAKLINQLVFVVFGAAALWLGLSYPGLMIAAILGAAVIAYLSWRWVRRLGVAPGRPSARSWRALLGASWPFAIGGLALALSYRFDSVLLNIFRGDAETGYYNAVYNLVFTAAFLPYSLNSALYPSLTRHAASLLDGLPRVCERMIRYLLILGLPIAVSAWVLADRIVPFLFTAAYAAAIPALQIVMIVTPLMFMSDLLGYVAVIQRFERRIARAAIVSTGLNVTLNLVLVPRFGLLAAAVMTVVTEAALVVQYVWILRSLVRQIDWGTALARPLAAALSMGGLLFALHDFPLLISIPSGTLAYLALLLALGVIGTDEFRFVRGLRGTSSLVVSVPTDSQR